MGHTEFAPGCVQKSAYRFRLQENVRFNDVDMLGYISTEICRFGRCLTDNLFIRLIDDRP